MIKCERLRRFAGLWTMLAAGLLAGCAQDQAPLQVDAVIHNITVVDLEVGETLPNSAVVIADGKISAVVDQSRVQNYAAKTLIDGRGGFVVPALADAHVHLQSYSELQHFVLHGVGRLIGSSHRSPRVEHAVHEGVIRWRAAKGDEYHAGGWWSLPVVAETWDGLSDVNGFHVRPEHAMEALDRAVSGPVAEGSVGGGTGMRCHGFKCGTGTASRIVRVAGEEFAVGVLVQANYGVRRLLRIAGVPVGEYLEAEAAERRDDDVVPELSSIIIVIATDAPLLPVQLKRLAKRASLGLARNGSIASDSSGDLFIAFSTANADAARGRPKAELSMLANPRLNPLFEAVVNATEESIINSLVAGRTMVGHNGVTMPGIDVERVQEILRLHGRLADD